MSNKKKSQAAIIGLLDDLDNAGIATLIDDDKQLLNKSKPDSSMISDTEQPQISRNKETLKVISTDRCIPWKYADRSIEEMGDIESLADSLKKAGQQEPALVRKIKGSNNSVEFEIIFGHRRWHACKLIGIPLKVIVRDLTDIEAAIAQKEENENRKDVSDYSRAKYYKTLLENNVFNEQKELATRMNISTSSLNDLFSFNRIHPSILETINDKHNITKRMAIKLAALSTSFDEEDILILKQLSKDISSGKIPASKLMTLIASMKSGKEVTTKEPTTFKSKLGANLFTSRIDSNGSPIFVFHKVTRENININDIEQHISDYIKGQLDGIQIS